MLFLTVIIVFVVIVIIATIITVYKDDQFEKELNKEFLRQRQSGKNFLKEQENVPKSCIKLTTKRGDIIFTKSFNAYYDAYSFTQYTSEEQAKLHINKCIEKGSITVKNITFPMCNVLMLEIIKE